MLRILALALIAALFGSPAYADFTGKNAAGSTMTFKNSGDCTSVVCVVQQQPVDSTGAAFGVTANPFFVTSTTLGTAANQSTIITALGTLNTSVQAPIATQAASVIIGGVGVPNWAGGVLGAMANYGTSPGAVLVPGMNAFITNTASVNPGTAASWAIGTVASPSTNVVTVANPAADPCQTQAQTITPFTVATATTQAIVTGTSAKKIYVCYMYMQTGLANNVAVISGTTAGSCAANVAALVGGTTAAAGLINAANSGQAFGNGSASVLKTAANADDICLITSAAGPLAGVIKYVVQ